MVLTRLANICSHLNNSSKARLGLTSIPNTKLSMALMLALQNAGFISTVTRAGPHPPQLLTATAMPHASDPALLDPSHPDTAIVTPANAASRRIWIGLKYWKEMPVLSEMKVVSRPRQHVRAGYRELDRLIRGKEANYIRGLTQPGECLFVSTDNGIMEAREAAEKKLGGLVLCRAV